MVGDGLIVLCHFNIFVNRVALAEIRVRIGDAACRNTDTGTLSEIWARSFGRRFCFGAWDDGGLRCIGGRGGCMDGKLR